ncbi:MAG: hypothetical protein U1F43_31920 [Myxococcota bacterium]
MPVRKERKLYIVGAVCFVLLAILTRYHLGFVEENDPFESLADLAPAAFLALAAGLGLLAGLFTMPFGWKPRLWLRAIVGVGAGLAMPFLGEAYLDLRGNPERIMKVELFVPALITLVAAAMLYAIIDRVAPGRSDEARTTGGAIAG